MLKTSIGKKPKVIWDWLTDEWRIGEGGFFMLSDDQIVFGKYPDVFTMKKGKKPEKYFDAPTPVKRIRAVENNQILLIGDNACYLTRRNGKVVNQWNQLLDDNVKNPPLNRNQIFDADYRNECLLYAYWGKRSFDLVDDGGVHHTLLSQSPPYTPHWVAFWGDEKLLFSSQLVFDGSTPMPHLVLWQDRDRNRVIWD